MKFRICTLSRDKFRVFHLDALHQGECAVRRRSVCAHGFCAEQSSDINLCVSSHPDVEKCPAGRRAERQ